MENMFEKGCLVQLSVGKWGGVKKIDSSRFANIIDAHEWLTATKKLVDPESLRKAVEDSVPPAMQKLNLAAFDKGYEYGLQVVEKHRAHTDCEEVLSLESA